MERTPSPHPKKPAARKRLSDRLSHLVPPGTGLKEQLTLFFAALAVCVLFSLWFLARLRTARAGLFYPDDVGRPTEYLRPGAMMPFFDQVMGVCLTPLRLLPLAAAGLAVWYFFSYRMGGSRADYLMRRLPRRGTMARQCLTVPVWLALGSLAVREVLTLVYFFIYLKAAPAGTLPAAPWTMIWSVLL